MRFAATHKAVSYLMVSTAFLVLALSGELSPEMVAITVIGIAGSFFFDPQRYPFMKHRLYQHGWNVALLILFGLSFLSWLRGEAILTAGTRFLCYLLLGKLWNRRANRDYLQAYVISFFMLVAGTVLNNSLAYAGCFVAYVVFSTWTLTLFHLRREMEENYLLKHLPSRDGQPAESERVEVERILNSRRVVGGSFLLGTSGISIAIFLISSVIFVLTPRVGMGLDIPLQRRGITLTGFSDRIELGTHGRIRDNPQVVMRVEIPTGKPGQPIYMRGVSFDHYERGRWSRSNRVSPEPLGRYHDYHVLGFRRGVLTEKKLTALLENTLRTEIYLEPMDSSALFAPSKVIALATPPSPFLIHSLQITPGPGGELFAPERKTGTRYSAFSRITPPSSEQLLAAPEVADPDEELMAYLDLPKELPQRIRQLALELTKGAVGPHRKAMALLGHLRRYAYTIQLTHDNRYDPIDEFLFVKKRGHCEYFASAMAIMLRMVGVPSRSVNGFLGGEWNEYGRYLVIRQQHAHSWVEAYLPGLGWITYDPTPPSALLENQRGPWAALRHLGDTLEMSWFKYVIEYDLRTQMQLAENALGWAAPERRRSAGISLRDQLKAAAKRLGSMAGVIALGAGAAYLIFRLLRRERAQGSAHRKRTDHLLRQVLALLRRRGFVQRPGETLLMLCARVQAARDPVGPPLAELVPRYYAIRFGGEPLEEEAFRALVRKVLGCAAAPPAGHDARQSTLPGENLRS